MAVPEGPLVLKEHVLGQIAPAENRGAKEPILRAVLGREVVRDPLTQHAGALQ